MIQDNSKITVINKMGELIFSNPNLDYISQIKGNHAFAHDTVNQWYLIDKQGNIISNKSYSEVRLLGNKQIIFKDQFALVKIGNYWGTLDTLGNFSVIPNGDKFDDIYLENDSKRSDG